MNQGSASTPDDQIINLPLAVALRLGLAALLVVACLVIVSPFMVILLWSGILAVARGGLFVTVAALVGTPRGAGE